MDDTSRIAVALAKCAQYDTSNVPDTVGRLLETVACKPARGTRVLVKPNLLAPTPPDFLPCTHPLVVRAVCQYLLDLGAEVRVGDSPTFGNAIEIGRKIGLTETLADLPVRIVNLTRPRLVRLSSGRRVPISQVALENDLILSVSKLKTHHQVRITAAVKNVYGCITGLGKPILHLISGDSDSRFERMLLDIWKELPQSFSLMDAVTAMHGHGPTHGEPYPLGLLAASPSPVALDSAVMSILGLRPAEAPLWQLAQRLNLPGAKLEDLTYPLETPDSFTVNGFKVPDHLVPISFRPWKLAAHWIKRKWALA
jgi:uncharacterized protein (DUF362 family)